MGKLAARAFDKPDERRTFERGSLEVVDVAGSPVGRFTFEPGWRWSTSVKPKVGTESCQVAHLGYVLAGRMHVVMDDGTEGEAGPGDAVRIDPGHDAWVVGDEPFVSVEFLSADQYAK